MLLTSFIIIIIIIIIIIRMKSRQGTSPNIDRVIKSKRQAGHGARMEGGRSSYKILTPKLTGNKPLGRSRR